MGLEETWATFLCVCVCVCRKNLLPEKFDLDRDFSKTKEIQPGSYDGGRGTTNDITDPKERKRARVK